MKYIGGLEMPTNPVEKCIWMNWNRLEKIQTDIENIKSTILGLVNGIVFVSEENGNETYHLVNEEHGVGYGEAMGFDPRAEYVRDNSYTKKGANYIPKSSNEFFYQYSDKFKNAWFVPMTDMSYLEITNEFRKEIYKMSHWWSIPMYKLKAKKFDKISEFQLGLLDETLDVINEVFAYFEEFESSISKIHEQEGSMAEEIRLKEKNKIIGTNLWGAPLKATHAYHFYFPSR